MINPQITLSLFEHGCHISVYMRDIYWEVA